MLRIWSCVNGTRLGALWGDQETVFTLTDGGVIVDFVRRTTDDGEDEQVNQPPRLTHATHWRRGDCLELNQKRIIGTPEPGEMCTICVIEEGEEPWPENTCVHMPCKPGNHAFHFNCIARWARNEYGDCPNCKYIFYSDECGYEAAVEEAEAPKHEEEPPSALLPASEIIDQAFNSTQVVIELYHGSVDAAMAVSLVRHVAAMSQVALPRAIIRTSSGNKEAAEAIHGVWQGVAVLEELPNWPPMPQF